MDEVTLGISLGHDSGVCLLRNDEILFAANEERFSRKKGDAGFPIMSLTYLLENFDIPIEKVALDGKYVAPHGIQKRYNMEGDETLVRSIIQNLRLTNFLLGTRTGVIATRVIYYFIHAPARYFQKHKVRKIFSSHKRVKPKIFSIEHHIAHAYSIMPEVFPKENSLIVTIDGMGEGLCSIVLKADKGQISKLSWQAGLASPALMYGYVTKILGFRMNRHEGKVTGLAAFGDGSKTKVLIRKHFEYNPSKNKFIAHRIKWGPGGEKSIAKSLKGFLNEDIAAGAQSLLEETVISYFSEMKNRYTDQPKIKLYVAGGLFANVKMNQRIIQQSYVESLHVAPNMGDGGLALGAARYCHKIEVTSTSLYLGPGIGSSTVLDSRICELDEKMPVKTIVEFLTAGKIVAVAQGRMEYGPRALGNRSILYDASNREVNNWLNKQLKRTEFMPFAPIGRAEDANEYFVLDQNVSEYKNMTITCDVTELCKTQAPAVVHIDGTARPQLITRDMNPFIWDILSEYKLVTGKGLLVNTSFNLHEEPIIRTSSEAIESFVKANLDLLVLDQKLFIPS